MSTILRQAAAVTARHVSRARTFYSSTVARKDPVQDLYVRALQGYQPPPTAKDAHVGVVKQFSLSPSPRPPIVTADLSSQLDAYDAAEPTSASVSMSSATAQEDASGADQFLTFLEADVPKPDHGHH